MPAGSMQASLSPQQQKEVNKAKALIRPIQANTHDLYRLMNQQGVNLNSPGFKEHSRTLDRDARRLAMATQAASAKAQS
jgi:hypothetical protein